jgi:flavin reductase (DIM6/NTAB) family NADH-FMN oxidoreductase RutF
MTKRQVPAFRPVYPGPAGLITSVAADGRANIITLGEVFNLSIAQPVIVGIAMAKPRYSHQLILEGGEFVVNLPPASLVEKVDRCGTVSGRDVEEIGDHDLFRGEVLVQHVDADKLDEAGNVLVERLDVLCYMMSQYWTVGRKLGEHGFTRRRGGK